jgi:hypothetical protein
MSKTNRNTSWHEILRFSGAKANQATVKKYYLLYRQENDMPLRCDNELCVFHRNELSWNGQKLDVILDHIIGVRENNRPENLRLLCPNCESQLSTHSGRNKGRIKNVTTGGYVLASREGKLQHTMMAENENIHLQEGKTKIHQSRVPKK